MSTGMLRRLTNRRFIIIIIIIIKTEPLCLWPYYIWQMHKKSQDRDENSY